MSSLRVRHALDSLDDAVEGFICSKLIDDDDFKDFESRLRTTLVRLQQHRNSSMSPMNKLPPELLGRIFEHVVQPQECSYSDCHSVQDVCRLAERLTWVCSAWRTVALAWPKLWYFIYETSENPADTDRSRLFLSRSSTNPLDVYLRLPIRGGRRAVFQDICNTQPYRVRDVHLAFRTSPHESNPEPFKLTIESFLSSPLPNLEYLCLGVSPNSMWDRRGNFLLFGGESSGLRALTLELQDGMDITLDNTFPNLLHLRIVYFNSDGHRYYGTSLLDKLLCNSPRLETLVIEASYHLRLQQDEMSLVPVRMAALHAVWIHGMPLDVALLFLARIEPSSERLKIKASELARPHVYPDPKTPVAALRAMAGLTHLDKAVDIDNSPLASEWSTSPEFLHLIASGPHSGIWFNVVDRGVDFDHVQRIFCRQVDLKDITALRISSSGPCTKLTESFAHFHELLPIMPSVSTLVLRRNDSGITVGTVTYAAHLVRSTLAPPDFCKVPVPLLESLSIELPLFGKPEKLVEGMLSIARARARLGHPLLSVTGRDLKADEGGDGVLPMTLSENGCTVAMACDGRWEPLRDVTRNPMWRVKNDYWRLYD
ncbi:hypothetical protein L226DRAFT_532304 [Lentinus tigrinus ALCF2SS1-7]|uniref:Uncharacterized protein n=1 Tax=Lentinus tigrinus ALCF2SS1-6 TaxID=1328759 RepID=A0A5C2SFY6_9APHY|nr:hypothetical protein L227DRAFT_651620 [Lentinus tigrinus ALCF2SS1-6]RPD77521.1 hypothetical protein L226DRAFT_532304 [Lentinus tigrinus ALCF2SS1-7]